MTRKHRTMLIKILPAVSQNSNEHSNAEPKVGARPRQDLTEL